MLTNPGSTLSIYGLARLFGEAYPLAFTPKNILSGFQATGIWPLNRDIFIEEDFLSSYFTDRPIINLRPSDPNESNLTSELTCTEPEAVGLNLMRNQGTFTHQERQSAIDQPGCSH